MSFCTGMQSFRHDVDWGNSGLDMYSWIADALLTRDIDADSMIYFESLYENCISDGVSTFRRMTDEEHRT